MLVISESKILNEEGTVIKEVNCPQKATIKDLEETLSGNYLCTGCKRNVVNTDLITEAELISILEVDKNACLKINLANPIFIYEE